MPGKGKVGRLGAKSPGRGPPSGKFQSGAGDFPFLEAPMTTHFPVTKRALRGAIRWVGTWSHAKRFALLRRLDLPIPALVAKLIQLAGGDPCRYVGHEAPPDSVRAASSQDQLCLWCHWPLLWCSACDRWEHLRPGVKCCNEDQTLSR